MDRIDQRIRVARQPVGGQAFTLTPAGKLPAGVLGVQRIKIGIASVTFSASTESDFLTVTHGLGAVPAVVLATVSGFYGSAAYDIVTATSFRLYAFSDQGAQTGTATVSWMVAV